jgi:hypothetical protein
MPSISVPGRILMAALAVVLTAITADISEAQFGLRIPGVPIIITPGAPFQGPHSGRQPRQHKDQPDDDSAKQSRVNLPPASATQAVFKGIVVSKGLGAVGVEEPIDTSKHDFGRDDQRNYVGAIKSLLDMIDNTAKRNSRQGDSSLSQGDVTQHSIDRSVSRAYEDAGLESFERFLGEQWTNERLRVAILERASAEVPGLLVGNNFSRVDMAPVDDIIVRASRSIYKRTLETSELIAVNQATARYTRSLFELHGPAANSDLRAGVEDMLLNASKAAFADYAERFVRSEYGVTMRYRAERILDDCLTSNVEEITVIKGQAATRDQVINKVMELSRGECRNWVVNAIGDPTQNDPKVDEQKLQPLPERAVWIAPGVPKTDASMFGRVTGNP